MTAVQLNKIAQTFAGKRVLDELSLAVDSGRYLVLLGASGCGKTTLLRVIAGLQGPDAGDVLFDGRPQRGVPPRRRDVSMVPQQDGLYPHRTIAQSMRMPLRGIWNADQIEGRVEMAVELTRIDSIMDRYPDRLSGGELRRAAIAKAIARGAAVRLLDEPLSALDAPVRQSLQDDLLNWHQRDPGTTIHVTHDGQEAMRMADDIAVIDDGRIVQLGSPAEIYQTPATLRVAQSIGTPTINRFHCFVDAGIIRPRDEGVRWHGESLASLSRGEIILAVRPGGLGLSEEQKVFSLSGLVRRVQPIDGRIQLTVACGSTMVQAIVDEQAIEAGHSIRLFANADHLLLFDSVTGHRLVK